MLKFKDLKVGDVLRFGHPYDTMYDLVLRKEPKGYTYYNFFSNKVEYSDFELFSEFLTKVPICEMWEDLNNDKI